MKLTEPNMAILVLHHLQILTSVRTVTCVITLQR